MKIVVTDGYAMNPGDLDWSPLRALGDVDIYDATPSDQVLERLAEAELVLTNKVAIDADLLDRLPRLRYIGVNATGTNVVDVGAAKRRGIVVTNVPAYGTASVAQFTFALLLELCHGVGEHARTVRAGDWTRSRDFCYWISPQRELHGKTLGIVGLGSIGSAVARIARAFGMNVLALDRGRSYADEAAARVDEARLLREADVLSLHCPLTPETQGWVNQDRIERMKPTALLINTSRGGLVVEADLAQALTAGWIAGAAVDVLSVEPPIADNPLFSAPRCIITPHIAWATRESRERLLTAVVENARAFLAGCPQNEV